MYPLGAGDRATGVSVSFSWGRQQKQYGSVLVGTSPEFELAVATTCLLARGTDRKCSFSLAGSRVSLIIHVFERPGGVRYVSSAYFDWK